MEILQFDFSGRGEPDIAETVYDSLHGFLIPACQLSWVEPVFVPGHPCHDAYEQMLAVYSRLRLRLGTADDDPDVEKIIDFLLKYSKIISLEMFQYGRMYQNMIHSGF